MSVGRFLEAKSSARGGGLVSLAEALERGGWVARSCNLGGVDELEELPALVRCGGRELIVTRVRGEHVEAVDPERGATTLTRSELEASWDARVLVARDESDLLDPPAGGPRFFRFLRLLSTRRGDAIGVALLSLVALSLGLAVPKLSGMLVDHAQSHAASGALWWLALALVLVHLGVLSLELWKGMLAARLSVRVEERLATLLTRQSVRATLAALPEDRVGATMAAYVELAKVRSILSVESLMVVVHALQASIFTAWLFHYGWLLAAATAGAAVLAFLVVRVGGRRFRSLYEQAFAHRKLRESLTTEQLEGVETLKSMGATAQARRRWEDTFVDGLQLERAAQLVRIRTVFGTETVTQIAFVAVLFVAGTMVLGDTSSAGDMLAVSQYAGLAIAAVIGIAFYIDRLHELSVGLDVLDAALRRPTDAPASTVALPALRDLSLHAVRFRHSGTQRWALDGVDLSLTPGRIHALVGASGSGKSTACEVMRGLRRASEGGVFWNGEPVEGAALEGTVVAVTADSGLLAGTLRENVTAWDPAPDSTRLERCARRVGADEVISALPRGWDTVIAEGGLGLSGGQRQRIALARALYADPEVLILDEATSAMDGEARTQVWRCLQALSETLSVLVVTHRVEESLRADLVTVLERGRVVEEGAPAALLARRGAYAAFFLRGG